MEKLDTSISKEYGPLVIWADDLIELFSELQVVCKDLKFVADDVKYDSIEEFTQESRGRKPTKVKIEVREPYLIIDLNTYSARLYISSSELLASGLFHKVDIILSRCERKPRLFFSSAWLLGSVLIIPNLFHLAPLKPFQYLYILVIMVAFLWMLFVCYIRLRKFSTVLPIRQEDSPSFIKRNIDSISIAMLSALFGAILGAMATKAVDKIWSSNQNISVERDISTST